MHEASILGRHFIPTTGFTTHTYLDFPRILLFITHDYKKLKRSGSFY